MPYRLLSLALIIGLMAIITVHTPPHAIHTTLVLGFLLLAAYNIGFFLEKIALPRITGYIFAGLLLGPHFLNFYNNQAIADLGFLNSLALAFIAFLAGAEIKTKQILQNLRTISFLLLGIVTIVPVGITLLIFSLSSTIPFMQDKPPLVRLAIAAIFGAISTARSPSSAMAIISETRAKGTFTDIVLSVTIAMDVAVVILFAIVISVCQVAISPGSEIGFGFIIQLVFEILLAFVLGFAIGKGMLFLMEKVGVELPIVIAATGFLVIKFCHSLSEYLHEIHDISLHLEPLLICMATGFTIQNTSPYGDDFVENMEKISLPIYVAFFAITGASINIDALKTGGWMVGVLIFFACATLVYAGTSFAGRIAGAPKIVYRYSWLGFITQAGVTLGLLAEVARRFPEVGGHIQSILIAAITLNQIVGPIVFKYALEKVGEAGKVS